MSHMICQIYRSSKKPGAYLYVNKSQGLACLPEPLLALFGKPAEAFTMLLTADKKLAHADAAKVLQALKGDGYYLQLPPPDAEYMQEINKHNDRLTR